MQQTARVSYYDDNCMSLLPGETHEIEIDYLATVSKRLAQRSNRLVPDMTPQHLSHFDVEEMRSVLRLRWGGAMRAILRKEVFGTRRPISSTSNLLPPMGIVDGGPGLPGQPGMVERQPDGTHACPGESPSEVAGCRRNVPEQR